MVTVEPVFQCMEWNSSPKAGRARKTACGIKNFTFYKKNLTGSRRADIIALIVFNMVALSILANS